MRANSEFVPRVASEMLLYESRWETIETGGDCSVCCEEVSRPSNGQRDVERLSGLLHEHPGTFQDGECRMAFVEMTDLSVDAQRGEQSPAANSENQFLF